MAIETHSTRQGINLGRQQVQLRTTGGPYPIYPSPKHCCRLRETTSWNSLSSGAAYYCWLRDIYAALSPPNPPRRGGWG